jgi:hypothetical protein
MFEVMAVAIERDVDSSINSTIKNARIVWHMSLPPPGIRAPKIVTFACLRIERENFGGPSTSRERDSYR